MGGLTGSSEGVALGWSGTLAVRPSWPRDKRINTGAATNRARASPPALAAARTAPRSAQPDGFSLAGEAARGREDRAGLGPASRHAPPQQRGEVVPGRRGGWVSDRANEGLGTRRSPAPSEPRPAGDRPRAPSRHQARGGRRGGAGGAVRRGSAAGEGSAAGGAPGRRCSPGPSRAGSALDWSPPQPRLQ